MREVVAAGPRRNSMPLAPVSPTPTIRHPRSIRPISDFMGHSRCPYGAHIRRGNPRGTWFSG